MTPKKGIFGTTNMNWKKLDHVETINEVSSRSHQAPVLIYKHSTRCSISSMVLARLERSWLAQELPSVESYFLDLINYREISNAISERFGVFHESPQVLVIAGGECVFHSSHTGISYSLIKKAINSITA